MDRKEARDIYWGMAKTPRSFNGRSSMYKEMDANNDPMGKMMVRGRKLRERTLQCCFTSVCYCNNLVCQKHMREPWYLLYIFWKEKKLAASISTFKWEDIFPWATSCLQTNFTVKMFHCLMTHLKWIYTALDKGGKHHLHLIRCSQKY